MSQHHVDAVIVVTDTQSGQTPVGIVTDRDLVIASVVAQDDPDMIAMDNICSRPPVTVTEKAGVLEALQIRCEV